MSWLLVLAIYAGVFLAIQILMWWALRGEPTEHGVIVGTQVGCIVGILWPIALPYFAVVAGVLGIRWLWCKATGRPTPFD